MFYICAAILNLRTTDRDLKQKAIEHMRKLGSFEYTKKVIDEMKEKLLEEEKAMIHHFYESDASRDEMEKEIAEVTARLQPKITYEVMSGGLIYLTETIMKDIA